MYSYKLHEYVLTGQTNMFIKPATGSEIYVNRDQSLGGSRFSLHSIGVRDSHFTESCV